MERFADAFATFITFLVFLFIILAPMLMAFMKNKQERRRSSREEKKKKKQEKRTPREGVSIFDAIRRDDRRSEPVVTFAEDRSDGQPSQGEAGRSKPMEEKVERSSPYFEEVGAAFDKPLSESFTAIGEEEKPKQPAEASPAGTSLPGSRFTGRLARLPELQRAVILSEILGPPKGLRE